MCDDEPSSGTLVISLPRLDGGVDPKRVRPRGEDEEERRQAEHDIEEGRNSTLHALFNDVTVRGA